MVLGVGTEVASLMLVPTPGRGRDAGKPAADAQELRVDSLLVGGSDFGFEMSEIPLDRTETSSRNR
ncbi:MAG: hypothetical protein WD598_17980 [Acidimicrobiia bacterium]